MFCAETFSKIMAITYAARNVAISNHIFTTGSKIQHHRTNMCQYWYLATINTCIEALRVTVLKG